MKIYVVTCDSTIDAVGIKATQEDIFLGVTQSLLEAKNLIERNVNDSYRNVWPSDGWTFNYESCYDYSKMAFKIKEIEIFDSESKYEDIKKIETLETEISDLKKKIKELKSQTKHGFDSGSKYTTNSFKEDIEHVRF